MITEAQLTEFYGEDEASEIARYTASNMQMLWDGRISPKQFVEMHIPEEEQDENWGDA